MEGLTADSVNLEVDTLLEMNCLFLVCPDETQQQELAAIAARLEPTPEPVKMEAEGETMHTLTLELV